MGLTEKLRSLLGAAFKPPVFENDAKTQQALVLYVNLWFAIFSEVLVALMGLANLEMLPVHALSAAANTLWFFFLLVLTRRGRTVLASGLCIVTIWTMTTGFALIGGGLYAPIISEYLVAIMVSGLLLGWRAGVWTMAASLIACAVFASLEMRGMMPRQVITYTPFSTLLLVTLIFADIVMLLALAVYTIGRSYRRAERELAERIHAEEALREKTEELRRFFSAALDLLCIAGMDGRLKRVNPAWESTLGHAPAALEGRNFMDFVHPEDMDSTGTVMDALSRGRSVSGFVNRFRCADGAYRWIEWHATPYQGSLIYAAARDITERKNSEEERARLDEQMLQSQKLESLGILSGGIAHDFNNLLAGIVGNADIILSDLPQESPLRPMAEMILDIAQRASGLCTQMLAYSGKGMITFEPLDLNRAVTEIGHILEASLSKKAELHYDLRPDLPVMEGDPTQVRQVVMNLVINAAEALEDRTGSVHVSTGVMQCGREFLQSLHVGQDLPPGQFVYLEVRDTGTGMDDATRTRIFDPFFSTKFTGRGLGLAAVLGIVRNHKGAMKVESGPGKGTTFRVMFPVLAAVSAVVSRQDMPAAGSWRGRGTVLLVDDESSIRIVGRSLLARLGFEVLVAENGKRAVELYSEHAGGIDCVILDLTMPQMDGEETFLELRRMNCAAPVIISSGYSEFEVAGRFAGKGVAGFLQKPYRLDSLRKVLRAALSG